MTIPDGPAGRAILKFHRDRAERLRSMPRERLSEDEIDELEASSAIVAKADGTMKPGRSRRHLRREEA